VEGRGKFYEEVGAIRDVVQNHLLQVMCHLAMEPPVTSGIDSLRDEKVKVLRAVRTPSPRGLIRGQYNGYTKERGVEKDSVVETFAALELQLDSWRWAGVPFFARAGKRLAESATEILVELKKPPQGVFGNAGNVEANYFRFRLGPDRVTIAIGANSKKSGTEMVGEPLELFVCNSGEDEMSAYERLIGDALRGDASLFAREDAVLEAWRIVDPLLNGSSKIFPYEAGSQGPGNADKLGRRAQARASVAARR
jgi:glucose-6-phosphate 1-dehydrogenase